MLAQDYTNTSYGYNKNPNRGISKYKWPVIILAVLLVIIAIVLYLINQMSYGSLVVSSNNKNALISISQLQSYSSTNVNTNTVQASVGQSIRLKPGNYSVTVSDASFSAQQNIVITTGKSSHVTLNLDSASSFQPVLGEGVANVYASSNQLLFNNLSTGNLEQINANNSESLVDSHDFTRISWASNAYGVGEDNSNILYSIKNGQVTPLNLPFNPGTNAHLQFSVAPNGQVYIATDSAIYKGSVSGPFEKIASVKAPVSVIAASNNAVAIFEGGNDSSVSNSGASISTLYVIGNSGDRQVNNVDITAAAWSVSGKYLAAVVNGQLIIWNANLNQVAQVKASPSALVWVDDNTLIYGINNAIWTYSINTKRSVILSQSTTGQQILQLSLSSDSSYVYAVLISTQQPTATYEVARVGLRGQSVSNTNLMGELSVFLPYPVNLNCSATYVNFSSPGVITKAIGVSPSACIQSTQAYLQEDSIDTSKLSFYSFN